MTYKNLPVDEETYKGVQILCEAYGMGKRGQGAMVKKLVKAELEIARAAGQLTDQTLIELRIPNPNAGELEFRAELRKEQKNG